MNLGWRTKLYIFAAITAIIPLAVSSFNMISITEDELKSNVNQELITTTGQIARDINVFYSESWVAPLMILKKSLESGALDLGEITTIASGVISNSGEILNLELFVDGGDGKLISAAVFNKDYIVEQAEKNNTNIDDLFEFPEGFIKRNEGILKGEPEYIDEIKTRVIPTAVNLDMPGVPPAVLAAHISLDKIEKLIKEHSYNNSGRLYLLNKKKENLFNTNQVYNTPLVNEAADLLRNNNQIQSVNNYTDSLNNNMVGCYAFPANPDWIVVAEIDENTAYAAVISMEKNLMYWVILGLGTAVVIVLLYSRQIGGPIKKITGMAKDVSSGNFDVKSEYRAKDEIGFLGKTLEEMSGSLKESFIKIERQNKELEEYNRTLEDKVKERTVELKNKNSELEQLLARLKQTQEQLIMHEKLASLGALTAGIAHEIRNPLNFVNNFSSLTTGLTDELNDEISRYKESISSEDLQVIEEIMTDIKLNVSKINQHGKRAENIVKNMLDHSSGDAGSFRGCSFAELVDDALNLAYHSFKNDNPDINVSFIKDYENDLPEVIINVQAVSRVVVNIVNNSLYVLSEKLKNQESFIPEINIKIVRNNDYINLFIRDNGNGISENIINKIFEPFFTTKPTGKGSGLGLSLSYDIITKMHNGEMTVKSESGEYTEFKVILPFRPDN